MGDDITIEMCATSYDKLRVSIRYLRRGQLIRCHHPGALDYSIQIDLLLQRAHLRKQSVSTARSIPPSSAIRSRQQTSQ